MTNIEQEPALLALPEPKIIKDCDSYGGYPTGYTANQMWEYGHQCAEQARAQQPSATRLPATLETAGGKRIVSLVLLPDALRNSRPNREDCNDAADVIEQLVAMATRPAADVLADAEIIRGMVALTNIGWAPDLRFDDDGHWKIQADSFCELPWYDSPAEAWRGFIDVRLKDEPEARAAIDAANKKGNS